MNWRDAIGDVAYRFGFSAAEVFGMSLDDLMFWHKQARRIEEKK